MAKLSAFAIILNPLRQVLLCHRRDMDLWNLPGGGVEERESPWDAVIREVLEEVGLLVSIVKLLGIYHKPNDDEVCFSFHCSVDGGALTLTSEADQLEWFDLDHLPQNTSPRQAERILDMRAFGKLVLADQTEAFMTRDISQVENIVSVKQLKK